MHGVVAATDEGAIIARDMMSRGRSPRQLRQTRSGSAATNRQWVVTPRCLADTQAAPPPAPLVACGAHTAGWRSREQCMARNYSTAIQSATWKQQSRVNESANHAGLGHIAPAASVWLTRRGTCTSETQPQTAAEQFAPSPETRSGPCVRAPRLISLVQRHDPQRRTAWRTPAALSRAGRCTCPAASESRPSGVCHLEPATCAWPSLDQPTLRPRVSVTRCRRASQRGA